ncbi:MAG: twin-arginine translocase TatA/TatE family subunit, partial [Nitrososphaerales archaeon]
LIIIIFLVGPKKLPEVAKAVGRAMGEFQKARQQIDTEFKSASQQVDNEVKSATQVVTSATQAVTDSSSDDPEVSNRKNLFDAAQALGIFPYGKTNEELSQMIKEKVDEKKESVPITQEGGQATQAMVKPNNPKPDSTVYKPIRQQKGTTNKKTTQGQKLESSDLVKKEGNSKKVTKRKTKVRVPSESQSKKSTGNPKPRSK